MLSLSVHAPTGRVRVQRRGVYGYGGRTPVERVRFWHDALLKPPMPTLLCYVRGGYHGFNFSEKAVRDFYAQVQRSGPDIATLQGNMKDRPADGIKRRAQSIAPAGVQRWGDKFGLEVHVDEVGGYLPVAFGWMRVQFVAVDLGYRPPYLFLDSRRVRAAPERKGPVAPGGGTVSSLKRLVEHYRKHGHHVAQWDMPIVAVRSDPGAAFTSAQFEEVLEGERVHHKLGVSGAHYQNGGVERHIQEMLNRVTSMYAEAPHVPRELHPYAIQLYVDVSRAWTVEDGKPPVGEAFTGKRINFIYRPLFRWGQPLLVFIPKPHRDWKFGVHAFPAMYVGLPPQHVKEGVLVYNPATRHVVLTRVYRVVDVLPDEWGVITGPLPGFQPGGAASTEELEAYLALQDPNQLPYIVADADEDAEDLVTVSPEEVRVQRSIADAAVKATVAAEEVRLTADVPVVPPRVAPRPIPRASSTWMRPPISRPVTGQPSFVQPRQLVGATATRASSQPVPVSVRVVTDSRYFVPSVYDPLLPSCPHLQYRLYEESMEPPRILSVTAKRDDDHPTMSVALKGPYRNFVEEAIDRELKQYTETFPAIYLFSQTEMRELRRLGYDFRMAVTSHMDITYKRDKITNAFVDAKARLCVHGDQDSKYDFSDIKSPTVRAATVKLLLAILAKTLPNGKTWRARTWDAKGAFLQTSIAERNASKAARNPSFEPEDPIVIRMPDGRYGLLLAYVYGLRQASREFQLQNDELLRANHYLPTPDPCLYMKVVGDDMIYVAVHVDDFWAQATCDALLDELDVVLTRRYGTLTRGVGNTLTYLGMVIEITPEGHVDVSGPGSATELLQKFRSDKAPVDDYPMMGSMVYQRGDEEAVDATKYRALIGGMNYYQSVFRPDLAYLVSVGASAMQSPSVRDWRMLERGMRYIDGTQGVKMRFHRDGDYRLHGWADASFQTRLWLRSQTGYSFSLGELNAMFYVKSQMQTPLAQSSTEAEYIALYQCVCEAVWLRKLLKALLLDDRAVVIYQDNTSAISWAAGADNFHRTKHIERRYHFTREAWAEGIIEIRYCPTADMVADILTKPLIGDDFLRHRTRLLGSW